MRRYFVRRSDGCENPDLHMGRKAFITALPLCVTAPAGNRTRVCTVAGTRTGTPIYGIKQGKGKEPHDTPFLTNPHNVTTPTLLYYRSVEPSISTYSSPSPFSHFMERKKPRGSVDDLAIVKAAAWAWYQRGSGSEGRPTREFDLTRPCQSPKPSRYRLEAMREAYEALERSKLPSTLPSPSHTDNSLLDTYEIDRISRDLDQYIESSHAKYYGRFLGVDRGSRMIVSLMESDANGVKKKKKKGTRGSWLRQAALSCGSKDDVVVASRGLAGGRRPEKYSPGR
ncbi:hypothetical protein RJ639_039692 [Escallonia herrerae]|uniref:Uncharacterized protein n=1 Tax=Escallonia herrerae TaxID=1293975 RepID=A0AA88WME6_9ASTE|nr:hypothetical protein RJ639_039692 [Escallonia herrerae]